jgi:glyoxylase-like metal-dependent hydrolase (beta-lactamase superfamily II)
MDVRIDRVKVGITTTYLLRGHGAVLVDPGLSGRGKAVLRVLSRALGDSGTIDLMVATHGHYDHIGAAGCLREALDAPFAIHRNDARWAREGTVTLPPGVTPWARFLSRVAGPVVLPLAQRFAAAVEPDLLIDDSGLSLEEHGIPGRIVPTPGHTPGSVSVLLETGDAFVGDLAMNGPPLCLRPSLGVFAENLDQMRASWQRLLDRGARTIHPAHGSAFPADVLG